MTTELKSANQAEHTKSQAIFSHEKTAELIRRFGWQLCAVSGDINHFPFIYTIGNTECGIPELLAIDCINPHVLNSLCTLMRKRRAPFWDGELIELEYYKYPVKAFNTNYDAVRYTWQVEDYYGCDTYAVQQIVIPDSFGRYPGDPQCEAPSCLVPILKGKCRFREDAQPDFARIEK
jgi:Domain of unknown function (DUF4262)